jgi:hypothetical protein
MALATDDMWTTPSIKVLSIYVNELLRIVPRSRPMPVKRQNSVPFAKGRATITEIQM